MELEEVDAEEVPGLGRPGGRQIQDSVIGRRVR